MIDNVLRNPTIVVTSRSDLCGMGTHIVEWEVLGSNGKVLQLCLLSCFLGKDLETGISKSSPSSMTVTERAFPLNETTFLRFSIYDL